MSDAHDHGLSEVRHEKPLWWALGLTSTFLVVEVVGGLLTNSLALLADAAHMATDTAGLVIALVAVRLARRPPDARRTFGYARLEALGALANGVLLLGVAAYILWEAFGRFRAPPPVAATGMLLVAVAGLVINLIAMRLLKAGSGESLNVKGAYLEVWSDMLGSLGVLIAAALIKLTGWLILDPILAVLIGLWVLPRTLDAGARGHQRPAGRRAAWDGSDGGSHRHPRSARGDRRSRPARLGAGVKAGGPGGARDRRQRHGRGCAPAAHQ